MVQERRQPLGGIGKDTFISAENEAHYRALQYDILLCIDSKIQFVSQRIDEINVKCPKDCIADFDKRYVKRVSDKFPFSMSELIAYCFILGALCGLGYITIGSIVKLPL